MSGDVKRFGDLTAAGSLAGGDLIPVKAAATGVDVEPLKATLTQLTAFVGTGFAPLASPAFTGNPTAPTQAIDNNSTRLATTAYVIAQASAAGDGTPAANGTAARGSAIHWARADHVHPVPNATSLLTGSGNYTVPAGCYLLDVTLIAGGGGGGAVGVGAAATATSGQSGGTVNALMAVTPGQVIAYVAGAKGTGGAAGNNPGNAGANTTFGTLTAVGGVGGLGSASGNAASPATTALLDAQAISQVVIPTSSLLPRLCVLGGSRAGSAGIGGDSRTATHGAPGAGGNNAAGSNATGRGASGGGAGSTASSNFAGGDGSDGAILIAAF